MLRKIRISLAVLFLVGITLLFVGIGHEWWGWMAKIQFLPSMLALNVATVAAMLLLTFIFGRIYCSVICPLGVFQDAVNWLRGKIAPRKRHFHKERRVVRYSVMVITIAAHIAGLQVLVALVAPYSAYGRIVRSIVGLASGEFVWPLIAVGLGTLLVIGVCAWFWGRDYCNTVCPVGSILSLASRFAIFRPRIDTGKCVSCGRCEKSCKAACIDSKNKTIDYSRCVDCFDCMESCKLKGIRYSAVRKGSGAGRTMLAAAMLMMLPAGLRAQSSISVRAGGTYISTTPDCSAKMFAGAPVCPTIDAKVAWHDNSGSVFDRLYKHPEFGIGTSVDLASLISFKPGNHLANIYNVYGFFDRPMIVTRNLTFQYTLAFGLGYSTGIYHPVTNPDNMIMGSDITAHINTGLELLCSAGRRSDIGIGVYYTHNSNGTSQLPNNGFNSFEAALTYKCRLEEKPARSTGGAPSGEAEVQTWRDFRKSFLWDIYCGGFANVIGSEFDLYNSSVEDPALKRHNFAAYPKLTFGGTVMYRYGRRVASGLGIDCFWATYADRQHKMDCILHPEQDIRPYAPVSVGLSGQQEFFYRNASLRACIGAYLFKRDGQNMDCRFYESLGLRYYIPRAWNIFVGVMVKAHQFRAAECALITLGKRF